MLKLVSNFVVIVTHKLKKQARRDYIDNQTHVQTVAVVACSRPVWDQASLHSNMECEEVHEDPP